MWRSPAPAEKLINDGAQLLSARSIPGQSSAIAQVAEQKGIPFVIQHRGGPAITEQGYKFVFRNFPTAPMILGDAFANQREVFEIAGTAPKSVVFMHVNDTFGTAMAKGIGDVMPKFDMRTRSPSRFPTIPLRAISPSRPRRPRRRARMRCSWSAASTTRSCSRASWSSSAGRRWPCSAWVRLVR